MTVGFVGSLSWPDSSVSLISCSFRMEGGVAPRAQLSALLCECYLCSVGFNAAG